MLLVKIETDPESQVVLLNYAGYHMSHPSKKKKKKNQKKKKKNRNHHTDTNWNPKRHLN